jgi:hypothetical protein
MPDLRRTHTGTDVSLRCEAIVDNEVTGAMDVARGRRHGDGISRDAVRLRRQWLTPAGL